MFGSAGPTQRFARDEGGATIVEFAIVAPLLLTMLFGIFQFGWTQHSLSNVRHAMDGASRALLVNPDLAQSDLQEIVASHLAAGAYPEVPVTLTKVAVDGGQIANLTATYVVEVGVPGLAAFRIPYQVKATTMLRVAP